MAERRHPPHPQEAIKHGLTRYFGSVCAKHPELNGERRLSSSQCVGCRPLSLARLRVRAKRKIAEGRAKQIVTRPTRQEAIRQGLKRYFGTSVKSTRS